MISETDTQMTKENGFDQSDEDISGQFKFESYDLRSITRLGEIWFIAADICKALEHTDPTKALSRLDDDERSTTNIRTPGGPQAVNIINESGLYKLMLTSRKANAKPFQKWITKEVLPSIRRTGRYETGKPDHVSRTQSNLNGVNVWLPEPGQYHVTVAGDGSYLLSKPLHDPVPFRQQTGDLHLLGSSVIAISALWLQNRLKYPPLTNGTYPHLHSLDLEIVKAQHIAEECMNKSKI